MEIACTIVSSRHKIRVSTPLPYEMKLASENMSIRPNYIEII